MKKEKVHIATLGEFLDFVKTEIQEKTPQNIDSIPIEYCNGIDFYLTLSWYPIVDVQSGRIDKIIVDIEKLPKTMKRKIYGVRAYGL